MRAINFQEHGNVIGCVIYGPGMPSHTVTPWIIYIYIYEVGFLFLNVKYLLYLFITWYWILSNGYIMHFLVSMGPNHHPYLRWEKNPFTLKSYACKPILHGRCYCGMSSRIDGSTSHVDGRISFSMNPYRMSWASLLDIFIKSPAKKMMRWPPLPLDASHGHVLLCLSLKRRLQWARPWRRQ